MWPKRMPECLNQYLSHTTSQFSNQGCFGCMRNFPKNMYHCHLLLAILCDLFGMVVWPFKVWNVLQVGDQTVSFESHTVLFLWNSHHIFPILSLQFAKLEWLNYKSAAPTRGTYKTKPISTICNIFGLFLVCFNAFKVYVQRIWDPLC